MRAIALTLCALALAIPSTAMAEAKAKLADLAWLSGAWEGEGVAGAPAVEVYSPAAGGQMIGHFRQLNADGTVMFYELITLGKREGVLTYSLKHFNPDLTGWEERNEVRHFPLTSTTKDRWQFGGIVYSRTGANSMMVEVATNKNKPSETLRFRFKRKRR
jgi:hypothetical protein